MYLQVIGMPVAAGRVVANERIGVLRVQDGGDFFGDSESV
jgi:hypothetical protein